MSYFVSPQACYRASRLTQMLQGPEAQFIAATPEGRVVANFQGHLHLFELDREGKMNLMDSVDVARSQKPPVMVID